MIIISSQTKQFKCQKSHCWVTEQDFITYSVLGSVFFMRTPVLYRLCEMNTYFHKDFNNEKKDKIHLKMKVLNLKHGTDELIYETERDSQTQRTDLWLPRRWGDGGGKDWEFAVSRCKLLHTGWINNKVALYSTGNYIQYPGINRMEKSMNKNAYMCITESLCCTAEINTTL